VKDGPVLLMGLIRDVLLRREPTAIIPKAPEWRPLVTPNGVHLKH
jgi:hypothetical protein